MTSIFRATRISYVCSSDLPGAPPHRPAQNVYYRRTRRLDVPLITEVRVLPEHETPSPFSNNWYKVARPISPRGQNLYLWYFKDKTLGEMSNEEKQNKLITELDVTYGDDAPWPGFEKLNRPVADNDASKKLLSVWLSVRRGVKRAYSSFFMFRRR